MPPAAYRSKVGLQQYLSTVPVLRGLGAEQYAELASAAGVDVFHDGEYICSMGEAADELFLVLSGEARARLRRPRALLGGDERGTQKPAAHRPPGPHRWSATRVTVVS